MKKTLIIILGTIAVIFLIYKIALIHNQNLAERTTGMSESDSSSEVWIRPSDIPEV